MGDHPEAVAALAAAFREQLQRNQLAGEILLSAAQVAAQEIGAQYPQADEIAACCAVAAGEGCGFCEDTHDAGPVEVPAWLVAAQEARAAAAITAEAVALAMGPDDGMVALAGGEPYQVGQQESTGQWLARLWRNDHEAFLRTYAVLEHDAGSQDAINEARRIIFGDRLPPPGMVPAVPRLSHPEIRNNLGLEGTRDRQFGSGDAPPPPQAVQPQEPARPRRRGRRR